MQAVVEDLSGWIKGRTKDSDRLFWPERGLEASGGASRPREEAEKRKEEKRRRRSVCVCVCGREIEGRNIIFKKKIHFSNP